MSDSNVKTFLFRQKENLRACLDAQQSRRWQRFLEQSQYWKPEQVAAYQLKKVKETCCYAGKYVPYYQRLFREVDFHPEHMTTLSDLNKVPFLTKQIIQDHIQELISTRIPPKKQYYSTTGGSTGIPMGLYYTMSESIKELSFIHHMWSRVGYKPGMKLAVLRGAYTGDRGMIAMENGDLLLSSYHMTDDTLPQYIEALRAFQPEYMHVYASSIYILCDYMKRNHIPPFPSLRAVLVGSENVYPHQRELVEEVLQCRLFSHYGHCERACLAGECEKSTDYHIFWQYGYTEILDSKDQPVTRDGEVGEIVATTFDHFAMPLIRYRTMDMAEYAVGSCSCGRNYPLIHRIKGRLQEALVTSTGRYIAMTSINMHSDVFDHVYQFQFYQDDPTYCVFNVVRRPEYTQADEEKIRTELKKKLGEELELRIRYVDEIPRTVSGKYRFLIQKLPVLFTEDIYND